MDLRGVRGQVLDGLCVGAGVTINACDGNELCGCRPGPGGGTEQGPSPRARNA